MVDRIAVLADRGVIEVSGADARALLQRLITNDVEALGAGEARYAALLTPQGKILTDFLVVAADDAFFLDTPAAATADLAKRLTMYRLRAAVVVADRSDTLAVAAYEDGPPASGLVQRYDDPRAPGLWRRAIVERAAMAPEDAAARLAFDARRIAAGVPESGLDYAFGEAFPHDANLDRLNGVDFRKGCYVGQEVVSRVQHRGTARKRIVPFAFDGEAPAPGTAIMAGEGVIGTFGSGMAGRGLGLVRIDRLAEATAEGQAITAAAVALRPTAAA